jgi:hypothetical protein
MYKKILTLILYCSIAMFAAAQAKKPKVAAPTVSMSAFLESGLTFDPANAATPVPADFVVKGIAKGYTPKQMEAVIRHNGEVVVRSIMEKSGEHDGLTNLTSSAVGNFEKEIKPFDAGNYTCELYVDRKKIFVVPFTITVVKNETPNAKVPEFRLMDGHWSKYGYISFAKDGRLNWNMYLTSLNTTPTEDLTQQKDYNAEVQLFYDDKPISDVSKQLVWCQRGKWVPINFQFKNKGTFVGKRQLLSDGKYSFKVKLNKEQRDYSFEVKNGKIIPIPEQDSSRSRDTSRFIEGLGTEFWIKRSK